MFEKRLTLFMGHYGSGKTFNAVSYAIKLAGLGKKVSIYDLDIVNPYFRTVDAISMLKKSGVELVVSPYAETNVDIPAMNSKSYQMIDDKDRYGVIDVGGDDRGALALGRFYKQIIEEDNYDAMFVVNKFRPETKTIEDALSIKQEIENVSKIKFTKIVNNSNLGKETTEKDILSGLDFCVELSAKANIPIAFTSVTEENYSENIKKIKDVLIINPIKYGEWL